MSREYFAHNFTIPMPLIQGELKLHKKKERIERFNAGDLFSCENQCNMSNIKQQIKLSNGRYQRECLDGFVGPCCNVKFPPDPPPPAKDPCSTHDHPTTCDGILLLFL